MIIYFLMVTGSTYAYLYLENKNSNITGKGGCFVVDYQATSINASNLVSTVNYQDGASSVITISKNSSCNIYDYANIYLHTNENITAPITNIQALRYKVTTDGGSYWERNGVITTKGDTLLATVPITSEKTIYHVYLWIDSSVSLGHYDNTSYSGYLYATSIQSSSVNDDSVSPILFLKKSTCVEGFRNWTLSNATVSEDNILTLAPTGTSGYANSSYYDVDGEYWYVTFDGYTTSIAKNQDGYYGSAGPGNGGIYMGSQYFNKSQNTIISPNGYDANGLAPQLPLNVWSNGFWWNGYAGYGKDVKYLKLKFETGNNYSQPITKIRNLKVYGQLKNNFYDIEVHALDNVEVNLIKYAKGEFEKEYFDNQGTVVTDGKVRVVENGYYTFYVSDKKGNVSISTILIKNIEK